MNKWIAGEVRVEVNNGSFRILGRKSDYSPYSEKLASYNKGWYPSDEMARGFHRDMGNALTNSEKSKGTVMLYRKWGSEKDEVVNYTSSIDSDKEIMEEVKLTMKAHIISLY